MKIESQNTLSHLFLYIYFNDLEKVIEFKNQFPDIYAKKEHFNLGGKLEIDLKKLTLFNQVVWDDKNWIDEAMPWIQFNRLKTEKMLDFWQTDIGSQMINREDEYNKYNRFFYCSDPKDKKVIILDTIPYFLEKGFREIDLRLYNRVACFDFKEVKQLLEQGAKCDIHFYEDGDSSALSRIEEECSFLASCEVLPEFKGFNELGYREKHYNKKATMILFGNLIGLAAHFSMAHLLRSYA